MADEAPLLFKRVLGSLRPASKAAEEALAAIGDKPVRIRITRTTGNVRRNALYWSCLAVSAPMLSEQLTDDLSPEMLHRVLKKRAGLVRIVTLPSGDTAEDYDSTSFAKMTEDQRARYIDWSMNTLAKWLGVDVRDLLSEGEAA